MHCLLKNPFRCNQKRVHAEIANVQSNHNAAVEAAKAAHADPLNLAAAVAELRRSKKNLNAGLRSNFRIVFLPLADEQAAFLLY